MYSWPDPPFSDMCIRCNQARYVKTASGPQEWVESFYAPVGCEHATREMVAETERAQKEEAA